MFNNPRYITRGISSEVPPFLQILMWSMIDEMEVTEKDYLQIFRLSVESNHQHIMHQQEVPEYSNSIFVTTDNPITAKIYVIDDETHSTMLLAEEY